MLIDIFLITMLLEGLYKCNFKVPSIHKRGMSGLNGVLVPFTPFTVEGRELREYIS